MTARSRASASSLAWLRRVAGQLVTIHRCVVDLAFTLATDGCDAPTRSARARAATDQGFALLPHAALSWGPGHQHQPQR